MHDHRLMCARARVLCVIVFLFLHYMRKKNMFVHQRPVREHRGGGEQFGCKETTRVDDVTSMTSR